MVGLKQLMTLAPATLKETEVGTGFIVKLVEVLHPNGYAVMVALYTPGAIPPVEADCEVVVTP